MYQYKSSQLPPSNNQQYPAQSYNQASQPNQQRQSLPAQYQQPNHYQQAGNSRQRNAAQQVQNSYMGVAAELQKLGNIDPRLMQFAAEQHGVNPAYNSSLSLHHTRPRMPIWGNGMDIPAHLLQSPQMQQQQSINSRTASSTFPNQALLHSLASQNNASMLANSKSRTHNIPPVNRPMPIDNAALNTINQINAMSNLRASIRPDQQLPQASVMQQQLTANSRHHLPNQQHLARQSAQPSNVNMQRSLSRQHSQNQHIILGRPNSQQSTLVQPQHGLKSPINLSRSPLTSQLSNPASVSPAMQRSVSATNMSQSQPHELHKDKVHIRFDSKKKTSQRTISRQSETSSNTKDDDDSDIDMQNPAVELEDKTRIVIDDDLEIVGCTQAEIMSHIRADCPIHKFVRVNDVSEPPNISNEKKCNKCFCYICDKLANQCTNWTEKFSPHCNAHSRASCWKARRNMKKSPLMNILTAEEITPDLTVAGQLAMKYIIRTKEAYITYRSGTPCDFHNVPCDCKCHTSSRVKADACAQCKAVHDTKKRFNYDPVRIVINNITKEIVSRCSDKPYSALVLFEALLSELCSHRPADFNQMTRMPSNPDPTCQCTTPQMMEESIEPELIKLFTLNHIDPPFKEKFHKCLKASIQPLQLKDVMKKFLGIRHWDDILLRAVITGQNTSGKARGNDILKESPNIIEMRVHKLDKDKKYQGIVRYLKIVKIAKSSKNYISDHTPILVAMARWNLYYTAIQGKFKDVCNKLVDDQELMKSLPLDFILQLFSLLSGNLMPPGTPLVTSYASRNAAKEYKIVGLDSTVLLLIYLIFMEVNPEVQNNIMCYMWLANWVNQEKLPSNPNEVRKWVQQSTELVEMSRKTVNIPSCSQFLGKCQPTEPQVALFTSSLLILQFLTKFHTNLSYVSAVVAAYKNNEWALFYLFSQPNLMSIGSHHVIAWLTEYLKNSDCSISHFNLEALSLLIQKNSFVDVCAFMESLIKPNWISQVNVSKYMITICAKVAVRLLQEGSSHTSYAEWLFTKVFSPILESRAYQEEGMLSFCDVIGKACCACLDIKHVNAYKLLFSPEHWSTKCHELFQIYDKKFIANQLNPIDVASYFQYAVKEGVSSTVQLLFTHFTDKHDCSEPTSQFIMDEVINIMNRDTSNYRISKHEVMKLYIKLCAHETLSWLICAKCSSKIPEKWMAVWHTLEKNKMSLELRLTVQHTFEQFTSWMKELCVQEKSDMDRLLHCLEVFMVNVYKTLLQCRFADIHEIQAMILETRFFIANSQLQSEYYKLLRTIFQNVPDPHSPPKPSPPKLSPPNLSPPKLSTPNLSTPNLSTPKLSPPKPSTPKPSSPKPQPLSEPKSDPTPPPPKLAKKGSEDKSKPTAASKPSKENNSKPSAPETPASRQNSKSADLILSPPRITSPTQAAPPAVCPHCGETVGSSFRCARCHSKKTRDVVCPGCKQVNVDVKGYSCRFCYFSLLGVLTTAEAAGSSEENPPEKSGAKKSKKAKKKKKSEGANQAEPEAKKKSSSHPAVKKSSSRDSSAEKTLKKNSEAGEKSHSSSSNKPHHIHGNQARTDPTMSKDAPTSSLRDFPDLLTAPKNSNIRSRSLENTKDQVRRKQSPPVKAKSSSSSRGSKGQMRHDSVEKIMPPSLSILSPTSKYHRAASSLSDSSDSDDSQDHRTTVSPPSLKTSSLLKRKSEDESTSGENPEQKRFKADQNRRANAPASSVAVNKGVSAFSKKQKNILQRLKNIGKVKKSPVSKTAAKTVLKSPEPEATKRRRPGPACRNVYYEVNPLWNIPRHLKVPYTLHLPRICRVQLSLFPPKIMRIIHHHQPSLKLDKLYA